jgi:GMP synthase-like glutamine amidotransferase
VLAGSAFTPFGVLAYPQGRALSFQFHPEFSPGYAAALIELRRGSTYDVQLSDEAIASLRAPNDSRRVASWIRRFITSAQRA